MSAPEAATASWFPVSREQGRLDMEIILQFCSNLSGGYLKDWHKALAFLSPSSELQYLEKLQENYRLTPRANYTQGNKDGDIHETI